MHCDPSWKAKTRSPRLQIRHLHSVASAIWNCKILLLPDLYQQEGHFTSLLSMPTTHWYDSFCDKWSNLIEVNVREINQFLSVSLQAKHVLRNSHKSLSFLLFCLCTENLSVQTSKSKTNNIMCLCPLCKQIIKSSQSARLIIMIITLSLLVERQNLE